MLCMIKMKNFLFKKIEIWIVGLLIIFFIISIIFISGILRDAYLEINKSPKFLRNNLLIISEIPKNIFHSIKHIWGHNIDAPPKLTKHKSKKRFEIFKKKERDALLILPRYDHSLSRSIIDIIDLKNFELIHSYRHDIDQMNDQVKFTEIFPRLTIDDAPIRFEYRHPLLLDDGSIISDSDYTPEFKIDFCSNLKWINDKVIFHHSKMLDHEKNIWVVGQMIPQSDYVNKYQIKNFMDDSIIKINVDGKILYKKSVIEILIENKIIPNNFTLNSYLSEEKDPIHLNDIEPVLTDTQYWKKGDLFLSIRNQSAIIHYRPATNQVIKYITGPFAWQHDVDIISEKEISLFNNNNFIVNNEYSEVLIYNYETNKFKKVFNDQLQKENFKTFTQGLSHIFDDGALLVEEQNHGRIILFNNKGEKEWEFVNKDKDGDIGFISWSRIIEDSFFIKKYKSLIKSKKCEN